MSNEEAIRELLKANGIRHFILETKDYGNFDVVEYKEYLKLKEVIDKIKNNNKRIIDYGYDYDGFNNVEDLKKLIDMLVDYARKNNELLELEEIK